MDCLEFQSSGGVGRFQSYAKKKLKAGEDKAGE